MVITMIDEARARRANWIHRPRFDGSLEPKPSTPERPLDTPQVDWNNVIEQRIADERERMRAVLIELIAEMRDETAANLERATRSLTAELADLKATLAELRLVLARDRTTPIDLPRLRAQVN